MIIAETLFVDAAVRNNYTALLGCVRQRQHCTASNLAAVCVCCLRQTLISLQSLASSGQAEVSAKYVRMLQVKYWPSTDDDTRVSVDRQFSTLRDLLVHVDRWRQRHCCSAPVCVISKCVSLSLSLSLSVCLFVNGDIRVRPATSTLRSTVTAACEIT